MLFRFNITVSRDDYFLFNDFHCFESSNAKKQILMGRIFILTIMAFFALFIFLRHGWSVGSFLLIVFISLFSLYSMIAIKTELKKRTRKKVAKQEKAGKLPYTPEAVIELHEDRLVSITTHKRIEQDYCTLPQICIIGGRLLILYDSRHSAYILPISQIKAQANWEDVKAFLMQKCDTIDYY